LGAASLGVGIAATQRECGFGDHGRVVEAEVPGIVFFAASAGRRQVVARR
jgi:hypothetical protein